MSAVQPDEQFIQQYKFTSAPVDRAGGVATLLHTAVGDVTVWWIWFHNHSGVATTVWLEAPAGTRVTARVQMANNQTTLLAVKPLDIGNQDIYVNAFANDVEAQIGGVET